MPNDLSFKGYESDNEKLSQKRKHQGRPLDMRRNSVSDLRDTKAGRLKEELIDNFNKLKSNIHKELYILNNELLPLHDKEQSLDSQVSTRLKDLQKEREQQGAELQRLGELLQQPNADTDIEAMGSKVETWLKDLQKEREQRGAELQQLGEKIQTLWQSRQRLETGIQRKKDQVSSLEVELTKSDQKLKSLEASSGEKEKQLKIVEEAQEELKSLKNRKESITKNLRSAKEEMRKLQEEKEKLDASLANSALDLFKKKVEIFSARHQSLWAQVEDFLSQGENYLSVPWVRAKLANFEETKEDLLQQEESLKRMEGEETLRNKANDLGIKDISYEEPPIKFPERNYSTLEEVTKFYEKEIDSIQKEIASHPIEQYLQSLDELQQKKSKAGHQRKEKSELEKSELEKSVNKHRILMRRHNYAVEHYIATCRKTLGTLIKDADAKITEQLNPQILAESRELMQAEQDRARSSALDTGISRLQEQITGFETESLALETERLRLREQILESLPTWDIQKTKKFGGDDIKLATQRTADEKGELHKLSNQHQGLTRRLQEAEQEHKRLQDELEQNQLAFSQAENAKSDVGVHIKGIDQDYQDLEQKHKKLLDQVQKRRSSVPQVERAIGDIDDHINKIDQDYRALQQMRDELRNQYEQALKQYNDKRKLLLEALKRATQKLEEDLRRAKSGQLQELSFSGQLFAGARQGFEQIQEQKRRK